MTGVAGRSGRTTFVPTAEQRNSVKILVSLGLPQKQICRLVINPQTDKPLDDKTLRKHFAREIATGTTELHARVGNFMVATILGLAPPAGTVAIDDQRARGSLLRFFAETRMGWQKTSVHEHTSKDGGPRVVFELYPEDMWNGKRQGRSGHTEHRDQGVNEDEPPEKAPEPARLPLPAE
jgi:hypothetical protein